MKLNDTGVTATALTPSQVFEGRLLRIPSYQRGYAWQRQQWDEFIEDLELLPPDRVHYTGTIVLHAAHGEAVVKGRKGKPYLVFDVVDGQQRLTTIVLLLDAIRRELANTGQSDLAEGLTENFLEITDRNGQPLPKLTLGDDSRAFFFDHILHDKPHLGGDLIRAHLNLLDAKEYFTAYLRGQREERGDEFGDWLEGLRDKVCEQLSLTVYAVDRESDAGVIFEVMNNRGKPITEMEKVKNYLLYLSSKLDLNADHELPGRVNAAWSHMLRRLMSSQLETEAEEDQLLRSHWLMAHNPSEKAWDGSKSLKQEFHLREYVGRHEQLLDALIKYVDSLRDAATAYCDVFDPTHADAFSDFKDDPPLRERVVHRAEKLRRLDVLAPFLPLLMAIRLKYPRQGHHYLAALEACERYAFRVYRLLRRQSRAGRSSLILIGHAVYIGNYSADLGTGMIQSLTLKYSTQYEFEQAFALAARRDWYKWAGIRYLLYEYEEHLSSTRNRNMRITWAHLKADEGKVHTIEHILPRTPTDPYWQTRFDAAKRDAYTDDLGNLCLTLDNSSYGNKPFPAKRGDSASAKKCYATGDLVMERDLAKFADWTEESILGRREAMVTWALSRWGLGGGTTPVAAAADVEEETGDDE